MNKLKSILFIIVHLMLGLMVLIAFAKMPLPGWLHVSFLIFIAFLILNLSYHSIFKLNAIKEYWSPKKLPYILPAIVAGGVIAIAPTIVALLTGALMSTGITFENHLSFSALIITFFIVGWEELWFRGLFLNYCNRYLSPVAISIIIGVLFLLVHILNPEIDFFKKGPALFGAGALLTILYFYYRSIWVPLGVHFGNNYLGGMVKSTADNDTFFGVDGYCSAIILLLLFTFFVLKARKSTHYKSGF